MKLFWKHGMEENVDQKVGLKVARALQLIKRESDYITKNLKTQGKTIIHEKQFAKINVVEVEFMINWDNALAWEKFNKAQKTLEEVKMEKLESTKNAMVVK